MTTNQLRSSKIAVFWLLSITFLFPYSFASSSLSYECGKAINILIQTLNSSSSCLQLIDTLNSTYYYEECTTSSKGLNCMSYGQVSNIADEVNSVDPIVVPYTLPTVTPSCPLCNGNEIYSSCDNILELSSSLSLGIKSSYGPSYYHIDSITYNEITENVISSCFNTDDQSTLAYLRYQSELVCSEANTYGYPVTSYGNINEALDMRATMQCGYCAVIPCNYGEYCPTNGPAKACPAGSYCPNPAVKYYCPKGYYCPESSTYPIKCRTMAAGSCNQEGTTREVVWIPLFIAMIFFSLIIAFYREEWSAEWWTKVRGLPRPDLKAVFNRQSKGVHTAPSKVGVYSKIQNPSILKPERKSVSVAFTQRNETHELGALKVSVQFDNVKMITGKTTRIDDVSGHIQSEKFTAILGGSGAGKTSLMNAILARENITSGSISFQAKGVDGDLPQGTLNRIIGFVPQTDVLIRSMTVYQAIRHAAQTRLPPFYTQEMVNEQIEFMIEQLGLESIRDVIIGGDEDFQGQGLSPGDRKKVNIAMELVTNPSVLFLDEPTSGIDASSALAVMNIVHSLAHSSLTCVAVIHQPRGEIFDLIDNLILLIPGGRIAYQGPIQHVMGWFNKFGYDIPHPKANRTDFLLDVTCGKIPKVGCTEIEEESESWDVRWKRDGKEYLANCGVDGEVTSSKKQLSEEGSIIVKRVVSRPFLPFLVYLHAKRTFLQRIKGNGFILFLLVHLLAGIIMGIITCGGPLVTLPIPGSYKISCPPGTEILCVQWQRFQIGPSCFLINMILGCITIPTAVNTFGREKEISYREVAVGVRPFVYWLGKLIGDIPFCVIGAFFYIAPIAAIAPWKADTGRLYIIALLLSLFVTGFGYNLSFLYGNPDNATLAGAILSILFNLFGGFVPNLGDNPQGTIFYTRYVSRLIVTAELYGGGIYDTATFNNIVPDPWKYPNFSRDIGVMIIIITGTYILSYIGIRYNLRRVKL